jgi:hypothetical protein
MNRLHTIIKKTITKKCKGNTTSIFFGQLFMMILFIWGIAMFRMNLLNTTYEYIDDAITSSLLGATLVNIGEYGKTNQLVIHDNDEYIEVDYSDIEKTILLSEYNSSGMSLDASVVGKKKIIDLDARGEKDYENDEYLRRSVTALLTNLRTNVTNGASLEADEYKSYQVSKLDLSDKTNGWVDGVNAEKLSTSGTTDESSTIMSIPNKILETSFVGQNVISDLDITRFDVYSVYRQTFAEPHTYQSEYLTYGADGSVTGLKAFGIDEPTDKTDPDYIEKLEDWTSKKAKYDETASIYDKYKDSLSVLTCYIDTGTTYQGDWNTVKLTSPYSYFYLNTSYKPLTPEKDATTGEYKTNEIDTSKVATVADTITQVSDTSITEGKAPIVGYSHYQYLVSSNGKNRETSMNYTDLSSTPITSDRYRIKITNTADGQDKEIENTSLYIEVTFTIKFLPHYVVDDEESTDDNAIMTYGTKRLVISKLVDIEVSD